jgi:iron-sulfur cluster assembly accessory protein
VIQITDSAKDKLKEVLDKNPGKHLRVVFQGFGWGGPSLGLTLDEPKKGEVGFLVNGLDVLIEEKVKPYAEGNTVDYVTEPKGAGFTIVKAGAEGGCGDGCGGSCH